MKKPVICNHMEWEGQEYLMEHLPEEKRRRIAELLQERMMEAAGYRRRKS